MKWWHSIRERVQIFFQSEAPELRCTWKVKHSHLHEDFFFEAQLSKTHLKNVRSRIPRDHNKNFFQEPEDPQSWSQSLLNYLWQGKKTYALHVTLFKSWKLSHHHYLYLCILRVLPIVHLSEQVPGRQLWKARNLWAIWPSKKRTYKTQKQSEG